MHTKRDDPWHPFIEQMKVFLGDDGERLARAAIDAGMERRNFAGMVAAGASSADSAAILIFEVDGKSVIFE